MSNLISQGNIGNMACGPCAIAHALKKDIGEVKDIILDLLQTQSEKYKEKEHGGKRMMYSAQDGMVIDDMQIYLAKKYHLTFNLCYLNRNDNEKSNAFVHRIHKILLKATVSEYKPIVEIRSFVVKPCVNEDESWDYKWFSTLGHFNVIAEVPEAIDDHALGFQYKFIDSLTGKLEFGYLYHEKYRDYHATRDFTVDVLGKEHWQWVTKYPYLIAITPNIHLNTEKLPYQARTITVLKSILIYKEN